MTEKNLVAEKKEGTDSTLERSELAKNSPIEEFLSEKPKIQCLVCGSGNFLFEHSYGIERYRGHCGGVTLDHNENEEITISCQDCGSSMTAYRGRGRWHVEEPELPLIESNGNMRIDA